MILRCVEFNGNILRTQSMYIYVIKSKAECRVVLGLLAMILSVFFEALKGTILYKGDILGNLYLHLASYFNI